MRRCRTTAEPPNSGYARQDVRRHHGEARSFQIFSQMLDRAGIDHLIAVDIHSPALEDALPMRSTRPTLINYLANAYDAGVFRTRSSLRLTLVV